MTLPELKEWLVQIRKDENFTYYPVEFKKAVVAYINDRNLVPSRVAELLKIERSVLLKWVRKYKKTTANFQWN